MFIHVVLTLPLALTSRSVVHAREIRYLLYTFAASCTSACVTLGTAAVVAVVVVVVVVVVAAAAAAAAVL